MNAKTVELHLLQSFPPSCVNRDGNNSPKDCEFGGYRRARISSQCLKRAIRQADSFAETVGEAIATRSKQMRDKKLIPYLLKQGVAADEAGATADAFRRELAKDDKKPEQTSVGLYFGDEELFRLLDAYRAAGGAAKWNKGVQRVSADVALFGRMLAEANDLNVDAASQVAHALSTHRLAQDMDYWTAADDLKGPTEDAGAGMMGNAEFNASVFYRYACVSLPTLIKNLGDEDLARKVVEAFLLASWDAIPSGKINGHAHYTMPFLAIAVVREKGMPSNLCNAFLNPINVAKNSGLDVLSARALFSHLEASRRFAPVDKASYLVAHQLPDLTAGADVEHVSGYGGLVGAVVERL